MKRIGMFIASILVCLTVVGVINVGLSPASEVNAKSSQYLLKVNKQRCVVTAYKKSKSKWKPVRAMLCSPGTSGKATPSGRFKIGMKSKWAPMLGGVWGRYVSQIYRDYLFHSVWYYKPSKNTQASREFNKLGRRASHGCVRLSVIDAKWIFGHCKAGTKVQVYSSRKAGPLGKPKKLYSKSGWDPTDPSSRNPYFKLRKAIIKINKTRNVQYASKYNLKRGVKIINPNANENITYRMKVKVKKKVGKKYKKAKFSTRKLGKYKITYSVKYPYCRRNSRTIIVNIVDWAAPIIDARKVKTEINVGETNLFKSVKAKQPSGISRTGKIRVDIKAPDGTYKKNLTPAQANSYKFTKIGQYQVVLKVPASKKPKYGKSKSVKLNIDVRENNTQII